MPPQEKLLGKPQRGIRLLNANATIKPHIFFTLQNFDFLSFFTNFALWQLDYNIVLSQKQNLIVILSHYTFLIHFQKIYADEEIMYTPYGHINGTKYFCSN